MNVPIKKKITSNYNSGVGTMSIYSPPGTKVRYTGKNGNDLDHKYITDVGVKVGDILTVDRIEVSSYITIVFFEGILGGHNSVIFEDLE